MKKVRSVERVHDAVQWKVYNAAEINKYMNGYAVVSWTGVLRVYSDGSWITVEPEDWVVRDVRGEYTVFKPDTFNLYFEEI